MTTHDAGRAGPTAHVPPAWFERLARAVPPATDTPFSRFSPPPDGSARQSAVLVLIGPGSGAGPDVLLTQRSARLRSHAGQIAFPGGRIDPQDAGPAEAALREAVEETRLDPAGVELHALGRPLYVPVTNFEVTPVIAWWRRPSAVAPGDPAEVARVVRVAIGGLADPANRFQAVHPSGFTSPAFAVDDLFIWGFTAGVLAWLLGLAGLERPWDALRRRPVPADLMGGRRSDAEMAELTELPELTELAELLDEQVNE
jgi:8-oxo-dGTP pyrophosphatase MutT (NUDIX family)